MAEAIRTGLPSFRIRTGLRAAAGRISIPHLPIAISSDLSMIATRFSLSGGPSARQNSPWPVLLSYRLISHRMGIQSLQRRFDRAGFHERFFSNRLDCCSGLRPIQCRLCFSACTGHTIQGGSKNPANPLQSSPFCPECRRDPNIRGEAGRFSLQHCPGQWNFRGSVESRKSTSFQSTADRPMAFLRANSNSRRPSFHASGFNPTTGWCWISRVAIRRHKR